MSKGYSGMFNGTKGSRVAFGSTDYMKPTDDFSRYIKRRKDADANGFYDIIAHGNPISIEIQHNGQILLLTIELLQDYLSRISSIKDKQYVCYHVAPVNLIPALPRT